MYIDIQAARTPHKRTRQGMQMKVSEIAALMGVTESEAQGFIDCLRVWTDKGYTVEQAIARNLAAWQTAQDNLADGTYNELSRHRDAADALKARAIEWFYPQQVQA